MTPPNDPKQSGRPAGRPAPGGPTPAGKPAPSAGKPAADWKRHMLARVGASPVELAPDTPFVIGRANETDLPVPSARVSRRHTEIFWKEGRPWIKDLGSQNGTQVNGKRIVSEQRLVDNDEISIGPFLCTYRCMGGVGSVGKATPAPDTNALTQPMLADAMAGRLDLVNLFELLQTLEFNQKTGTLEVFGTDGQDGRIIIKNGAPVHAESESNKGEEAIFDVILAKAGQFSFSPSVEDKPRNVNRPMTSLLLEAGRRADEKSSGA